MKRDQSLENPSDRLNVYAGPAGFYIIRGGPDGDDAVLDSRSGTPAVLPGPAPKENDQVPPNKSYYEIPMAIQDRSFNNDGSLFYPNTQEFFDEIVGDYIPVGDFSPIWNPEFFGNTIMVNGNTWRFQTVEQVRYRFRFLNGCQSRFLILNFSSIPGVEAWQIGNEGGFLAAPVNLTALGNQLLMGLAERADVIVDFTNVPVGNYVLGNVGPDEPFGGGVPGVDFDPSDARSTGQVMEFRVVPAVALDRTTPPKFLAFAGGCFWCMEPPYDELEGVISTISGYTGGTTKNPTYEQVSAGTTGHTEAVEITYDPKKVSYEKLLEVFWRNIDPVTANAQFCDSGSQYRSAIFYHDSTQKTLAEASKKRVQSRFKQPIVTELVHASEFYPAEDYHQDYYKKNPIRYKVYRYGCGRDSRLQELWGAQKK